LLPRCRLFRVTLLGRLCRSVGSLGLSTQLGPMSPSRRRTVPPPSFEQVVGQILRELRTEQGLSQERLGNEAGSGRTYVSQLERGERGPSLKMVFKLARRLGVEASEIVRRIEEATTERK
jgi:DNA-binding XRE family transcriptional regulator